jgi:hypothetical protein
LAIQIKSYDVERVFADIDPNRHQLINIILRHATSPSAQKWAKPNPLVEAAGTSHYRPIDAQHGCAFVHFPSKEGAHSPERNRDRP